MPKKRGQGEGSIRERFKKNKEGKKVSIGWEARYTSGVDKDGKQIRRSIYGKTSDEVKKKLRKVLFSIDTGTYVEPTKTTVSEWLDTWFETYKKPNVKVNTLACYDNIIKNHIKPSDIGKVALKDLRPESIQKLYNGTAAKYSPRMSELVHVTLHGALDQAMKNGLVFRNITELVTLPKKVKKEPRVLTPEEQKKFMKAYKGHRLEIAFILFLFTGLRRGELFALRWADINLKDKYLKVNQTYCRVKNFDDEIESKTILAFDTPKSEKSKRIVPLLDEVITALKAHKKRQSAEKFKAGQAYQDNGLVVCNELGRAIEPRKFSDVFHTVVKKADIDKANIHAMRHTFATRGLENGIELKVMQELLGHSSIVLTGDTYSHVLPDKKREAINKLKEVFKASIK